MTGSQIFSKVFWAWFFACMATASFIASSLFTNWPEDFYEGWPWLIIIPILGLITIAALVAGAAFGKYAEPNSHQTKRPLSFKAATRFSALFLLRFICFLVAYFLLNWAPLLYTEPRGPGRPRMMDPWSQEEALLLLGLSALLSIAIAGAWTYFLPEFSFKKFFAGEGGSNGLELETPIIER